MNHFLNQALIFISATILLVPLFHRSGFGSVLGYLIAGIVVGPYCLKLIEHAENILHFAELGVVILLFIIGLEIQPRKLWSMRKDLICLGGSQVLICSVIFMFIGKLAGLSTIAAGIIGFGLSLSSTAFALQTLTEKNQLNTEFGKSSLSILLMQDLLAIPALAIIPTLAQKTQQIAHEEPVHPLISFTLVLFALVMISRFLMRPIFRIIAGIHSREIFTATTLFIVFGVSALMLKIGLSAALGTFIAGVLLADSEYRHELEANLEPYKNLLMGLFFIGVGMSVSLPIIMERPFFVLGLSISYLLGKMFIIYTLGWLLKMKNEDAKLMAISIGQGGEFAFVMFGIALTFDLAPAETLALLTAVITISMALNPLIGLLNERITLRKNRTQVLPAYDEIKDESPQVIIAGFGRFGQIFGRMLKSQNIPYVAIDHDAGQIELLRKFEHKVYYGDASQHSLLEAAGAARAKYFILAIDDMELSLKAVHTLKEHYPHIKIFARARNRGHVFDLMDAGVEFIKRETFDSSVNFTRDLLIEMGIPLERANQMAERFKLHDEIMLHEQYKVRSDDKSFVSVSKQGQAQLADVLNSEGQHSYIGSGGK